MGPSRFLLAAVALIASCSTGPFATDGASDTTSETTPTSTTRPATSTSAPVEGPIPTELAPHFGELTYEIVREIPHDPSAFTQGLELVGDRLLESTGLRGQSTRRWIDPDSGEVLDVVDLDPALFGEGITVVGDHAYQLTYTSQQVLISNLETLEQSAALPYEGEGWGLCFDGVNLQMSNGQPSLVTRSPDGFAEIARVTVTLDGDPVSQINELECVGSQVWANIWKSDLIIVIDPTTGVVDAVADLSGLVPAEVAQQDGAVLNGIAYRPETHTFFVTGKNWPVMYELAFRQP